MSLLCGFAALNEESLSRGGAAAGAGEQEDSEFNKLAQLDSPRDSDEDQTESGDEASEQALQEEAHYLYNHALGLYGQERYAQAAEVFYRILDSTFLKKRKYAANQVAAKFKFNALKYLGYVLADHLGKHDAAADKLSQASRLDPSDANLQFKLGVAALRSQPMRLRLARWTLERTILLSPNHFPALDLLVSVTFKFGDLITCLALIERALQKDPGFTKGTVLGNAIVAREPAFHELCPSLVVDERVLEGRNIDVYPPPSLQPEPERRRQCEALSLGWVKKVIRVDSQDWESLLERLLEEQRKSEEADRVPPNKVTLEYQSPESPPASPPASSPTTEAPTAVADLVEVSVQNVVHEMVDLISGAAVATGVAEEVIEKIIGDVVCGSSRTVVSLVLDEVLDDVAATAKEPVAPSAAQAASKRSSNRSTVAAFVQEIPIDLLEKRRSSRVKGGAGFSDVADDRIEEVTAQSLLERFIPKTLLEMSSTKDRSAKGNKPSQQAESSGRSGDEETFPSQAKQLEDIREFLKETSKPVRGMQFFEDVFFLVLNRMLRLCHCAWSRQLKRGFVGLYNVWRRGCQLADEISHPTAPLIHWEVMLLANEIGAESVRDDWEDRVEVESVEDDFLHLRLCGPRVSKEALLRIMFLHHTYYRYTKEIEKAITYGKMALSVSEDLKYFVPPAFWKVTTTTFDREQLSREVMILQNSQTVEGVEELFQEGEYKKVADILSRSIDRVQPASSDAAYEEWLEKLFMLTESQWQTRDFSSCLNSCSLILNKMCSMVKPNETLNVLKTVDCCLQMLEEEETMTELLSQQTAASLCQSLMPIILAQINGTFVVKTTLPWLLFYQLVRSEELRDPGTSTQSLQLYPPSVDLLIASHYYLGQSSLCTEDGGRLLLLLVETLTPLTRLSGSEELKYSLDQALYCLYCHPSKKSRAKHLVDHAASPLALTWDKCGILMSVVRPKKIPEFDDFKALSVSADTEALLKRFVALVPDSFDLSARAKKLEEYLNDRKDRSFPTFPDTATFPDALQDLFYLLADYHFKNSNFDVAAEMYVKDLTFNPKRLDSLVALSLSRASMVEEKLCRNRAQDLDQILKESYQVLNSFRESLHVDDKNATIYIESANFAYVMSAYCSRLFKSDTSELSMESFDLVEKRGKLFVAFARSCYRKALEILETTKDPDAVDETWLVRFMNGKLMEKKAHGGDVDDSLEEYILSMENLIGQGAEVPKRIGFGPGTPELSLELLEVYYRFHATILKLEVRLDGEIGEELLKKLTSRLEKVERLPIFSSAFKQGKADESSRDKKPNEEEQESQEEKAEGKRSEAGRPMSWDDIAERCIDALERTKSAFPQHYKALHQLSNYFLRTKSGRRDVGKARRHLMGPANVVGRGEREPSLFGERKANNLFNGIWRMPVNEFERAGSFSAHVGKCVTVLFEMFRETEDHMGFLEAACLLRKAPEGDRKYLFEEERRAFHVEACTGLIQILHKKTAEFTKKDKDEKEEENEEKKTEEEKPANWEYLRVRFFMDVSLVLAKLKKFYPKCDQIKDMLKKLYCAIAARSGGTCTFDEIQTLFFRLNQADKSSPLKCLSPTKFKEALKGFLPDPKTTAVPNLPGMPSAVSTAATSAAVAAATAANVHLINNMWMAAAAAAASNQLAMFNAASSIAQQTLTSFSQEQVKALLAQQTKQKLPSAKPSTSQEPMKAAKATATSHGLPQQRSSLEKQKPPTSQAASSKGAKRQFHTTAHKPPVASSSSLSSSSAQSSATAKKQARPVVVDHAPSTKLFPSHPSQTSFSSSSLPSSPASAQLPKKIALPLPPISTLASPSPVQPKKRPHPSTSSSLSSSSSANDKLKLFSAAVGKTLLREEGGGSAKRSKKDQPPQAVRRDKGGARGGVGGAKDKGNDDDDDDCEVICLD